MKLIIWIIRYLRTYNKKKKEIKTDKKNSAETKTIQGTEENLKQLEKY